MRGGLFLIVSALIAGVAGGCTPASDTATQPANARQVAFSSEDRRVASLLSLGGGQLAQASAEGRALLCSLGLDAISDRLRSSGALTTAQEAAFEQAQALFRKQAADGYQTAAKLAEARARAEIDYPTAGDRARLAVACLRKLI